MSKTISLLQQVKIASPCPVSWESMTGDETVRYCGQCKLDVYNLSALTDEEAEALLRERTGRMCGRIYRRHDGTVLTRDCPVGMRAIRRPLARMVGAVAASLLLGAGAFGFYRGASSTGSTGDSLSQLKPFATIQRWLDPTAPPPPGRWLAGDIAFPLPVPTTDGTTPGCKAPTDPSQG